MNSLNRLNRKIFAACLFILITAQLTSLSNAAEKKTKAELPSYSKVKQIVQLHFHTLYDFQKNDLITRSQVKPLFKDLRLLGWKVSDEKMILHKILVDHDFLARELRSPKGKKIMREISSTPGIYDLLKQMSNLRGGTKTVHQLLQLPNGAENIKTLKTTKRGKTILDGLQKGAPKGTNINKPTGMIFTQAQLQKQLKISYELDKKKHGAKNKQATK